jgi:hypothetical protein
VKNARADSSDDSKLAQAVAQIKRLQVREASAVTWQALLSLVRAAAYQTALLDREERLAALSRAPPTDETVETLRRELSLKQQELAADRQRFKEVMDESVCQHTSACPALFAVARRPCLSPFRH